MPRETQAKKGWGGWALGALLLGICLLLFFPDLGQRSLWETDEARYAEIAREMVQSGDWVTPRLNYVKYFEKPPLAYWTVALSFKLLGVHAYAARLTPAVFGTMTVMLAFLLGRRLWDARSGFFAGLALATCLMFFLLAKVLLVDMILCFGLVLSLWGAWSLRGGAAWGLYAFWAGCAAGFLSKGLLGLGLPIMVVSVFAALAGEWRLLRELARLRGVALGLALCAPWVVMVSLANPEFLNFFFLDQNLGRLVTTRHQRYQPFWFYLLLLPGAFFPWVALLPWAVARLWPGRAWRGPQNRSWLLVAVWFLSCLGLFSLSQSKMMHYALPMLPPLALALGRPLASLWAWGVNAEAPPGLRRSLSGLAVLVILAGLALLLIPALDPEIDYEQAGVLLLVLPLLLCGLGLGVFLTRGQAWATLAAPLAIFVLLGAAFGLGGGKLDPYRSVEGLVAPLRSELRPDDVLATYGDYYHGAAFYSGRRVVVVGNWGELDFGRALDPRSASWFIPDDAGFLKLLQSRKRVFVIAEAQAFQRLAGRAKAQAKLNLHEWARLGDKTLFSNQPR